jgi:hypothetical protein
MKQTQQYVIRSSEFLPDVEGDWFRVAGDEVLMDEELIADIDEASVDNL